MSTATLRCSQLVKVYQGAAEEVQAVRGLDLDLQPGSATAVLGPSGSGKSTLIRLLAGLDRPSAGSVSHGEVVVTGLTGRRRRAWRRRCTAFVHQRPRSNLIEHLDALDHLRVAARRRGITAARIEQRLEEVDLARHARRRPEELSGGEQHRLALAAATLGTPPLLIVDEPSAHLDDANTELVMGLLRRTAEAGSVVVYTTHDPRLMAHADRVVQLRHGVLASDTRPETRAQQSVVDASGRVQLPQSALDQLSDKLVTIEVTDDGIVLRSTDPDPDRTGDP
ncbi:ABC transporter ATP-binding protein [Euzebya tangerina]|uniref:ABC transporter ATP-binding protein n=1 Tax=Euzebya tangerina TaxID=591198 RepID=UPI000E31F129|nr:ATP-binding cassette domain-containing protein [Euzebya tangerina]